MKISLIWTTIPIGKQSHGQSQQVNNEQKIYEELEKIRKIYNYKDLIIVHGEFKNTITSVLTVSHKGFLNNSEVYELFENELMKKNHILLHQKLTDMKNENTNLDLYVFGKLKFEIKEAIELYSIKELYIEDKKLDKLRSFVDESFFNFKIIEIRSLENGDIAEQFIKDYNGIMGIKY